MTRKDVPVATGMLMWNDAPDLAGWLPIVADHAAICAGDRSIDVIGYDNAVGACFAGWSEKTTSEQLLHLLRDAWMAVMRDGADMPAMHAALLVVPEFRALLPDGELPEEYRNAEEG
jgi:hypothetical protein